MNRGIAVTAMVLVGLILSVTGSATAEERVEVIGRWNLMIGEPGQDHPGWLGIDRQEPKYMGRLLGGAGSVVPIGEIKVEGNTISFSAWDYNWTGTVDGDVITGTRVHTKDEKNKGPWRGQRSKTMADVSGRWAIKVGGEPTERPAIIELSQKGEEVTGTFKSGDKPVNITKGQLKNGWQLSFSVPAENGVRRYAAVVKGDLLDYGMLTDGPRRHRFEGYRLREWGAPVELFNGKDLSNWEPLHNVKEYHWKIIDGIMANTGGGGAANIVSKQTFRDFKAHIEFRVPEHGNSGVYLRGRHEIQVADSPGQDPSWHMCGALYSRIAPAVNACRKAGEWQTFDITLIGSYLTVVHNGQIIINNEEVEGITGGMIDSKENEPGPIYLQGDHGRIEYRKITIWPAK